MFPGLALTSGGGEVVLNEKSATLACTAEGVPAATFSWSVTDKEGNTKAQLGKCKYKYNLVILKRSRYWPLLFFVQIPIFTARCS